MSVTTKIESPGLARDSAPAVGSGANALRRAENIVIRSPGVMETRPSFDLLYENASTAARVRALREFQSTALIVTRDSGSGAWGVINQIGSAFSPPVTDAFKPPNYDASETRFAESRANLYMTGSHGVVAIENQQPSVADARMAGVEMIVSTDWHGVGLTYEDIFASYDGTHPEGIIPIVEQVKSCAYRFVFVRKDSNGYVRRSPPSYALMTTCLPGKNDWGFGTRFYVDRNAFANLTVGDQVEFYRTRAVAMGSPRANVFAESPRPEYYLAFAYTLTQADVDVGYFAPPKDVTREEDLGVELYTDASISTAFGAKYVPPITSALAWWQRVMWFGNTTSKQRSAFVALQRLYRAGPMSNLRIVAGTTGLDTFQIYAQTPTDGAAGLVVGMLFTDNYKYGPHVDGAYIPADSTITKIETVTISGFDLTQITLSHNSLSTGFTRAGTMMDSVPQGIIAEKTGNGVYVNGSKIVTSLASTAGWRAGMYWTDSDLGPSQNGTCVLAGTKIQSVDSPVQITMTTVARASATSDAFVGDVLTIGGVDLYAWIQFLRSGRDLTDHTMLRPWDGFFAYCFPIHDARFGEWGRQSALAAIVQWTSFFAPAIGAQAVPDGPITTEDYVLLEGSYSPPTHAAAGDTLNGGTEIQASAYFAGIGDHPYSFAALGFALEETRQGGAAIAMSSSCPTAFSPELTAPSAALTTNDARLNRVYFSDLDEPESVPLINYIDIGALHSPILALVPLRNALLVFKSDGLWRITGSGPSQWSVDPLDLTLTLLRPELVSVSQNRAYCWAKGGFYEVDESGARSLSVGKLDVELREHALYLTSNTTHGAWVAVVQERNIVLLGIPTNLGGAFTEKVLCYHQTTGAWTEWPVSWGKVAESASFDRLYQSRPEEAASTGLLAIDVEVRRMLEGYTGLDRGYALGDSLIVVGSVLTIDDGDFGTWRPIAGDWISATDGELRVYRRILTAIHNGGGAWTITLEAEVPDASGGDLITDTGVFFVTDTGVRFAIASLMGWRAHEAIRIAIEWHPTAPAGLPVGAIARELQFQLDLREAPDPKVADSLPEYIAGGSNESRVSPSTVTSNMVRVATVQPLRMGVTRQVARGANLAPYFATSDIYAFRLVGASIVYEGVSERTRR